MTFLMVNGIDVDVADGSFKETTQDTGDLFRRTLSGRIAEARGARSRSWSFRTNSMLRDDAEKLRMWLEGVGQSWNFDSAVHSYSGAGVANTAAGTITRNAGGGKYGGRLTVGSGSQFGVDMSNKLGKRRGWSPTDGWTFGAWRNFVASESASAGFHSIICKGAVAVTRGASANPAGVNQYVDGALNNSANLGRVLSVLASSPYVAICGVKTDNTNNAIDWDDWFFLPFVVPDAWVAKIHAYMASYAFSAMPKMKILGDAIPDTVPVEVVVRCHDIDVVVEADANNRRVLQVQMEEW